MAEPVRALNLPARTTTIYPPPYAAALEGRAKRALGDVFNLAIALRQWLTEECGLLSPQLWLIQQAVSHGLQTMLNQIFNLTVIDQQPDTAGLKAGDRLQLHLFDHICTHVFQPRLVLRIQFNRDGRLTM